MLLTHYTDRRNLDAIRKSGVLSCALSLMTAPEKKNHAMQKRGESLPLSRAVLRDQQPLLPHIVFSDGATFAEFVRYLNGHVFFWPDSYEGEPARRNFRKKYRNPDHIGLRCYLHDLRAANPKAKILFSPYNSGSTPRVPKKSPRSLNLFQPLQSRGDRRLVEVVIPGKIRLPENTQEEYEPDKWGKFFHAAPASAIPALPPRAGKQRLRRRQSSEPKERGNNAKGGAAAAFAVRTART